MVCGSMFGCPARPAASDADPTVPPTNSAPAESDNSDRFTSILAFMSGRPRGNCSCRSREARRSRRPRSYQTPIGRQDMSKKKNAPKAPAPDLPPNSARPSAAAGDSRRWTGCGPTSPSGLSSWKVTRPRRRAPRYRRNFATGSRTSPSGLSSWKVTRPPRAVLIRDLVVRIQIVWVHDRSDSR
jgi:hypothetical protein